MPLFNAARDNLLNLAGWLCDVLDAQEAGGDAPAAVRDRVREQVVDLCRRHPVYR